MRHPWIAPVVAVASFVAFCLPAKAGDGGGGNGFPSPLPSSSGLADVHNGLLQAGAGGSYQPLSPDSLPAGGTDPRDPRTIPPMGADPQGEQCPSPNIQTFHVLSGQSLPGQPPGSIIKAFTIYPSFVSNKLGGYDGFDPTFGYRVANAIPAGGDPGLSQLDAPATAAN